MSRALPLIAVALLSLAACRKAADPVAAPHQIHIVGASAAFPFSSFAAEQLMREDADVVAPLVRADGSGAGIARLCDPPGPLRPDIAIVTRPPSPAEAQRCAENGTGELIQVPIGFTAFVAVTAGGGPALPLTRAALQRALTSPGMRSWAEAAPGLPALPIRIEGPASPLALDDGLIARLAPGCDDLSGCPAIRRDGAYAGHGADAELVARAVTATSGAVGILPYAQAIRHRDTLRLLPLDGVPPTAATIADGRYPARATLLLLAPADRVQAVPGLARLLALYADALAPGGAFEQQGLVPLPADARRTAPDRLSRFKVSEKKQ